MTSELTVDRTRKVGAGAVGACAGQRLPIGPSAARHESRQQPRQFQPSHRALSINPSSFVTKTHPHSSGSSGCGAPAFAGAPTVSRRRLGLSPLRWDLFDRAGQEFKSRGPCLEFRNALTRLRLGAGIRIQRLSLRAQASIRAGLRPLGDRACSSGIARGNSPVLVSHDRFDGPRAGVG